MMSIRTESEESTSSAEIRLKVKVGSNEVEIETSIKTIREVIDLIPIILEKISTNDTSVKNKDDSKLESFLQVSEEQKSLESRSQSFPEIKVEKNDSLGTIITKMFREAWGKQPRRLSQVKDALDARGLIYPRQSVAVSLLRLAQSGRLRRFRGEDGEFIYTFSTSLAVED